MLLGRASSSTMLEGVAWPGALVGGRVAAL